MAESLAKINFQDIDYRGLKEGLIEFLKTTQSFKDANFEGSFLSHLVNMFSYTGAIFGNYVNAMASEQYIKTAQLYETGNMLGNLVGYKAHGFAGSKVSVTITPDFEAMGISENLSDFFGWQAAFPRNIRFSTKKANVKNKSLIFTNTTEAILTIKDPEISSDANTITLELTQGIPVSIDFVSDGTALQSFEIPNPFLDYKEVNVYVLNESDSEEKWTSALTLFYSKSDEKSYIPFINPKGLLEIMFGEGNFGKIPEAGRTIRIEYMVTAGASGKIDSLMIEDMIDNISFVNGDFSDSVRGIFTIVQSNASSEGLNIETLDRIKKFAPLYFGIQNRLVNHFDYKWFILGEFDFLTDARAFGYREAVDAGLLNSPCQNELSNGRWGTYTEETSISGEIKKLPTIWSLGGFYESYTVLGSDVLPLPLVGGSPVSVSTLLNFGTTSALYVDTTRPCEDDTAAIISQEVSVLANDTCCTVLHFELEVLNPEIDQATGLYPAVTKDNISLYINGDPCFIQISEFGFDTNGYAQTECCCNRAGDVKGWYIVKGIAILDNSLINTDTQEAIIQAGILVNPNSILLLGEAKVFPESCLSANDIFIVPVPETGGSINIETRKLMLTAVDEIKMINVRNHILAPIYQPFDVKVVYRKDETSLITIDEISNSIRSKIVELFLPTNRKLGDSINTIDFSNEINGLPGVSRAKVILSPRAEYLQQQQIASDIGDFQLRPGDFPILGKIQLA